MGSVALKVGCRYNLQQDLPPGALQPTTPVCGSDNRASNDQQDSHVGAAAAVPPYHSSILQAVGLDLTRLQDDYQLLNEPNDVSDDPCLTLVQWAVGELHDHLQRQTSAAQLQQQQQQQQPAKLAADTSHSSHRASKARSSPVSSAATAAAAAAAAAPTPDGIASMRQLPQLLVMLAELAALQPQTEVLEGVVSTSSICMAIAKLPVAVDTLQDGPTREPLPTTLASSTTSTSCSSAIMQASWYLCSRWWLYRSSSSNSSNSSSSSGSSGSSRTWRLCGRRWRHYYAVLMLTAQRENRAAQRLLSQGAMAARVSFSTYWDTAWLPMSHLVSAGGLHFAVQERVQGIHCTAAMLTYVVSLQGRTCRNPIGGKPICTLQGLIILRSHPSPEMLSPRVGFS